MVAGCVNEGDIRCNKALLAVVGVGVTTVLALVLVALLVGAAVGVIVEMGLGGSVVEGSVAAEGAVC